MIDDSATTIDKHAMAARLGVSWRTVYRRVRLGDFPHIRVGVAPPPGVHDNRPVVFTEQQAREIEAKYLHHVPAKPEV